MDTSYNESKENRFFILEGWLWGVIFVLVIVYGLLSTFNVEPWSTIIPYLFGALIAGALIIKVVKMRELNRPKRATFYGILTVLTLFLFFFPWQIFI